MGASPVLRAFYQKHRYAKKYAKYRNHPNQNPRPSQIGKAGAFESLHLRLPRGAAGQALTCPPWCIRTPPGCPPPHAGDAKLRPACPANAVIILLENTCPSYGQVRKSIMTSLPSENETYLVSPACGTAQLRRCLRQKQPKRSRGSGLLFASGPRPAQQKQGTATKAGAAKGRV